MSKLIFTERSDDSTQQPIKVSLAGVRGNQQRQLIIGTSGIGKSSRLQAEALRRGISYEELLKNMEPTLEQKQLNNTKLLERKEAHRLTLVREAYWDNTEAESFELNTLHDALAGTKISQAPTYAQKKALFMLLPEHIIGQGIAWGFDDTEVSSAIYAFVEQNLALVLSSI